MVIWLTETQRQHLFFIAFNKYFLPVSNKEKLPANMVKLLLINTQKNTEKNAHLLMDDDPVSVCLMQLLPVH